MSSLLLALLAATELTAASLTGLTDDAAREKLGAPDIARREAGGALWTYRKADCVLMVYLADKGQGLKVTGVSATAKKAGDPAPKVETCLAAAKAPAPAVAAPKVTPVTTPATPEAK
jgi:hypothetical protein